MLEDTEYIANLALETVKREHKRVTRKAKRYFSVKGVRFYDQDGDNFIHNLTTMVIDFETIHPKHKGKTVFTKRKRKPFRYERTL